MKIKVRVRVRVRVKVRGTSKGGREDVQVRAKVEITRKHQIMLKGLQGRMKGAM